MAFITTIETVKYCRENCELEIHELEGNVIAMEATSNTECAKKFHANLCKAISYIKAKNPNYMVSALSYEYGYGDNAIVIFEEKPLVNGVI